jgi:putative aminopeptidase FrvX
MRENRTSGSVRGALGNWRSYRKSYNWSLSMKKKLKSKKATVHGKTIRASKMVIPSSDEVGKKITSALDNPKYKLRTIGGIAKEVRLNRSVVVRELKSNKRLASTVKISPIKANDGSVLITTKERFLKEASFKDRFIDFFATKRSEIKDVE